jgi:hypothetical protein
MGVAVNPLAAILQDIFGQNAQDQTPNSTPAANTNQTNQPAQDVVTLSGANGADSNAQAGATVQFEQINILTEQATIFGAAVGAPTADAAQPNTTSGANPAATPDANATPPAAINAFLNAAPPTPWPGPTALPGPGSQKDPPPPPGSNGGTTLIVPPDANGNGNVAANAITNTATSSGANANAALVATANNAGTAATAATSQTPVQQQLQQLDQVLQQLGINPQSISLFNQLAMLIYDNNPAELLQFVQALQGLAPQALTQTGGNAAATANQTQTQNAVPAQNQNAAPAQTQNQNTGAIQVEAVAVEVNITEAQGTLQIGGAASPTPQAGTQPTAAPNTQNNTLALQFQELQLSFGAVGVEANGTQAQPRAQAAAAGSNNQGVDVRA